MLHLFDLTGKVALVTGGSVGIGRACATALAQAGADVAIVSRSKTGSERTCDFLRKFNVKVFFLTCDVANPQQVDDMTAEVITRFGRLDIAINNAGGSPSGDALSLPAREWQSTIDVNLSGVYWCARAQARQMQRQTPIGGKIINIASMYGRIAGGNCAYNASKAGVIHLTRSLAAEWGPSNINVNSISPGWMLTPGNRHAITPDLRQRMRGVIPMGSLLKYEDLHGAVIYLSSSASNYVTGHDLVIDGGHSVNTWLVPLERHVPPRTSPQQEECGMIEDLES